DRDIRSQLLGSFSDFYLNLKRKEITIYQDVSLAMHVTNPTEIEVFSSTPTPVDLANCSNTSNCKQNVKVTLMAPNSFALATSSMLSVSFLMFLYS
ncbi:LIM and calponin homology domains-containing protein, partial [Schistosoma japonicum]